MLCLINILPTLTACIYFFSFGFPGSSDCILTGCKFYKRLKPVVADIKSMDKYYEIFIPHLLNETWTKVG